MTVLSTDALDLRLDADGDLFVGPGGFELISGPEGVAQLCSIALKLFLEEWFLNLAKGMPWFQEILGHKFDRDLVVLRATQVLSAVPGVGQVLTASASFEGATRGVRIDATVSTSFGDVAVTATVGGTA